jgi:hypothetical protein
VTATRGPKRKNCKTCGEEFEAWTSMKKYCGPTCSPRGETKAPSYADCRECGSRFQQIRSDHKYCSGACYWRWRRKHGTVTKKPSPSTWNIAVKGQEGCRNCGARAAHLHHIVPRGKAKAGMRAVQENGLPLCARCHLGWHERTVTIYRDRLTADEVAFAEQHGGVVWVEKNYPYRPDEDLRRLRCLAKGEDPENQWRYCLEGQRGREDFDATEALHLAFDGEAYRRVTA